VDLVVITILQGGMRKDEGKGGKRDGEGWPFKLLPPDRTPCSWTVELLHSSKERGKAKNPVER
jgi:hypothetical protein